MRQLSEAVGEAEVIEVLPDRSIVEFTQEPTNLTEDTILRAIAISLPPPTIGIYLEGDSDALEQVRQQLQRVSPGEKPSLYIREEHELAKAQYRLLAKDGQYVITKPSDDRPLVEPLKGYDKAFRAVKNLEHIARWTTTIDLANPESQIPANVVKVQIYRNGEEVKDPHLRLEYEYRNGKWQQPTFQVKLTNTYEQRLFCAILDVAEDYSVNVPPLFPQGELSHKGGLWIEPGEDKAVWAAIWKGNRKTRDDIPASVPDKIWKQGVTEYQDVFKLIVSTAEFDATLLHQDDLSSPSVESSRGRRALPTRLNTLNLLMYQIQSRQFGDVELSAIDDWVTSQISITTVRPKDAVSLSDQAPTDLSFGVTIQPHSGLRADARLSSVPPSTRDVGSPTLPPILGDYTQPFQFTASRGVDSGLSVLELQVNDRETIETVTPENPLVLSVNKSIAQDEYILPVAYDGEFWLPLGQGKGKDGKTEIRIERIPTLDSEQTSGDKKRSLGGAIRIYFQKVIYENLGQESPYPKLRVARVAEDGTVSYEKDEQQIKAAVAKAQCIALYIHGIIGDTESMVPSVRQAKVMVNGQSKSLAEIYDLVLTFDYENLNTPIKELGRQLRDKLAAVGLKPNHGKTLHIVAHSMGGLVSRSFIEQWDGNRVVQHLFMLGTPNAGSPWAAVQDLVTFALAAGLNGLSSVVFPAKVLADLVALIEKIDVNLDEMHPTKSQFLQELKNCADPQCPYSIIAGNTSLIPPQEEAINRLQAALQRTWRRAIEFPFMKEANDIAVTVKSIVSVPKERSPAAYIQDRVACDHLSYFRDAVSLDALARAVARAFPGYSGPTTPQPNPIAPGGNTGKRTPSSQSPQPPGNPSIASTSQPSTRSTSKITTSSTAQSESGFANSYAVVIGINNYNSGIPQLRTAVNDAEKIAEILESEHKYTLISPSKSASQVENKAWLDGDATLENLNTLLKTLKETVGSDERLLFYFAGHGIALNSEDGPQGFLIPQDAKPGVMNTYLSMSQLREELAELPCRHCLIILDCCYSGAFRWSNTRQFGHVREIFKDNFDLFINDPAWQVITSSAHDQTAADEMKLENNRDFENEQHSPFANALMEALRDEAADTYPPAKDGKPAGDGIITADELYQYVRYQIELKTAQRNKRQTPGLWIVDEKHDKGVYVFLTKHFDKTKLPPAPTLEDTKESNPYRGLESYEEEHSRLFFGRTKLIEELCDRVCECPLTIVLGASGSGKSSLVKAGLIPHLKRSPEEAQQSQVLVSLQDGQTHRHKHEKWEILEPIRPGESPAKTLENALEGTNLDTIPTGTKRLLVIDQFEELVTQCRDQAEREQFLQRLSEQLEKYSGRLHLILTLRSDFEPQLRASVEAELKKHKNLASLLNAQQPNQSEGVESKQQPEERIWNAARFIVPPMTREELQEVIEAPAAVKAIQFDSDKRNNRTLVQQLIHEVADMPGALPLLSFALSELYRKLATRFINALNKGEIPDRTITWADYNELGGVTQSVTKKANDVYQSLLEDNPKEKDAYARTIRNLMLRMISLEGGEIARRKLVKLEWTYADPDENNRADNVINSFVSERLLVKYTIPDPLRRANTDELECVEPAHDALVRGWDKLQKWQQEEQEALPLQRRLTPAAIEWKSKEQSPSFLGKSEPFLDWCDKRIDSVEDWLNQIKKDDQQSQREKKRQFLWNGNPYLDVLKKRLKSYDHWFNKVETEFVQQSVWQRRRNTNLRWGITILVMLGLSGLTIWALIGQRNALMGQIRATRQSAESNLPNQELDALLDSLRAGKLLKDWPGYLSLFKPESKLPFLKPDTQLQPQVLQTLRKIFYVAKEHNRIEVPQGFKKMFFSPDGTLQIATAGSDGIVHIQDLKGNKRPEVFSGHKGNVELDVNWDGSLLATIDEQGTVRLWNLEGIQEEPPKFVVPMPQSTFSDVYDRGIKFSPDGKRLVASIAGQAKSNQSNAITVYLWDLSGNEPKILKSGQGNFSGINFNSNNQLIVATQPGETLLLSDFMSGKPLAKFTEFAGSLFGSPLGNIIFSPDGQPLAAYYGADMSSAYFGHLDNKSWNDFTPISRAASISFDASGQLIVGQDGDGTISVYKSSIINDDFSKGLQLELKGHQGSIAEVISSSNGKRLASRGSDNTIRLWDLEDKPVTQLKLIPNLISVSVSPDSKQLAVVKSDDTVRLLDLNANELKRFGDIQDKISQIIVSPDGQQLAAVGKDSTIRLLNLNGKELYKSKNFEKTISQLIFRPDGQQLAVVENDGTIHLLDLNNKIWETLPDKVSLDDRYSGTRRITYSADGRLLMAQALPVEFVPQEQGNIFLKELKSDKELIKFKGAKNSFSSVSLNTQGSLLASADTMDSDAISDIYVWDMSGKLLTTFKDQQRGKVTSISISADGSILATLSEDGTAQLWQLGDLDELLEQGCNWVRDYLATLDENNNDRHLCDDIPHSTPSQPTTIVSTNTPSSSTSSVVQSFAQNALSPTPSSNNGQDTPSSPANAPAPPQNAPSPTPPSNNEQNSHRQAPSDRRQASELNSTSVDAYINQGLTYHRQRNYQQAIRSYSKALDLNPKSAKAYSNRAAAYNEQKEYQKAIDDSDKALGLIPTYINRGLAYYHQDKYQQAIANYNKALELDPNNANAYHNRALAYTRLGNQQAAQANQRKAAALSQRQLR